MYRQHVAKQFIKIFKYFQNTKKKYSSLLIEFVTLIETPQC